MIDTMRSTLHYSAYNFPDFAQTTVEYAGRGVDCGIIVWLDDSSLVVVAVGLTGICMAFFFVLQNSHEVRVDVDVGKEVYNLPFCNAWNTNG